MRRLTYSDFTIKEGTKQPYQRLYKCLFKLNLDSDAIIMYTLLRDRCKMSADNLDKYEDSNGNLFVYFTIEELMKVMHRSNKPISKALKKLKDYGLIEIIKIKGSNANRIYITDLIDKL